MAGVDLTNQFPNSVMAQAAKLGQSRFTSVDVPSSPNGEQHNVSIASVTQLTIPTASASSPGNWEPPTYAVVTAVGGTMYVTYDGSVPSPTNYAIAVAAGNSLPVQGLKAMQSAKFIGTTMSVSYWT